MSRTQQCCRTGAAPLWSACVLTLPPNCAGRSARCSAAHLDVCSARVASDLYGIRASPLTSFATRGCVPAGVLRAASSPCANTSTSCSRFAASSCSLLAAAVGSSRHCRGGRGPGFVQDGEEAKREKKAAREEISGP